MGRIRGHPAGRHEPNLAPRQPDITAWPVPTNIPGVDRRLWATIDVLGGLTSSASSAWDLWLCTADTRRWHHRFVAVVGSECWLQGVYERAVRLADAERGFGHQEAGLAEEDESQSRTEDEQHRPMHRAAALIHRDTERLETQAPKRSKTTRSSTDERRSLRTGRLTDAESVLIILQFLPARQRTRRLATTGA
jgi:hypothetical protein